MPHSRDAEVGTAERFGDLNLSITGLGVEYPPYTLENKDLDGFIQRHYPESPAMTKISKINKATGILTRSSITTLDNPILNREKAPTIDEISKVFLKDGVALAVAAARKALHEAQISPSDVTHVVSTTCTNSANPGFDHYVCTQLGITQPIQKVLLHGVGCSGGLATLRTAANLALGSSFMGRRARVLIVTLEISSMMVRSELDSLHESQKTRIGIALFSDCGSAAVLSNGIGEKDAEPIYDLLGWDHRVIPETEQELGFDVHPLGWKVILTPRVPILTAGIVGSSFNDLLSTLPDLPPQYREAADFDWALHPGGSTILTGVENAMSITPGHMRASYDTYKHHGNSSSATMFSVMNRLRQEDMDELAPGGKVKDFVVGCAFGPGVTVETCLFKRNLRHVRRTLLVAGGEVTPPLTETSQSDESEGNRSDAEGEAQPASNGEIAGTNGKVEELLSEKLNTEQRDSVAETPEVEAEKPNTEGNENSIESSKVEVDGLEAKIEELVNRRVEELVSTKIEELVNRRVEELLSTKIEELLSGKIEELLKAKVEQLSSNETNTEEPLSLAEAPNGVKLD